LHRSLEDHARQIDEAQRFRKVYAEELADTRNRLWAVAVEVRVLRDPNATEGAKGDAMTKIRGLVDA
jgi:hypothetical protein